MPEVYHALGLHLHQPLGNLVALHNSGESWEARQILCATTAPRECSRATRTSRDCI